MTIALLIITVWLLAGVLIAALFSGRAVREQNRMLAAWSIDDPHPRLWIVLARRPEADAWRFDVVYATPDPVRRNRVVEQLVSAGYGVAWEEVDLHDYAGVAEALAKRADERAG